MSHVLPRSMASRIAPFSPSPGSTGDSRRNSHVGDMRMDRALAYTGIDRATATGRAVRRWWRMRRGRAGTPARPPAPATGLSLALAEASKI
jgi:hypothetical protein